MNTCIPIEQAERLRERLKKGEIRPEEIAKMLPEEKAALKTILEDFVTEKLGVSIKAAETKVIAEKAKKIDEAQEKLGEDLGNPEKTQENIDFFKAKKEMDDYLESIVPANRLKVLTGTIGRGMMLASIKSPILNIGSNMEVGFTEALARRLSSGQIRGADNALAVEYMKMVNKVYQASGYDLSRMLTLSDSGVGGARVLGDTVHSGGPGGIRRFGRLFEDIVFKQLMGAPDVAFSAAHFADSVNLNALKLAEGNREKATEIMRDSMRLEPSTPEGLLLREQGILDAQVATWTNKTWASNASEGIRSVINKVTGNARLGDYLLPFVKTPANVIATGVDYAGGGAIKALVDTVRAYKAGELKSREYTQKLARNLVRSGLGLVGALVITSQLNDDDFVGAYDPKRAQIEALRNSTNNSIRIGDKWVSTAWFGPLGIPVTAIMYARKYGDKPAEKAFQFAMGTGLAASEIPGVKDIFDGAKAWAFKQNQTLEEMTGEASDYAKEELASRLYPSILSDIAKAIDPYVRETKGNKFFAKVPGVSMTLPVKRNIFGEPVKGEGPISDILFGSRVKTDMETAIVKEISRVSNATDKGINFTDWSKSSSLTLKQFKEKVGEKKFETAKAAYGKILKAKLQEAIKSPKYKELSDDDKLSIINDLDAAAQVEVFKQYNFKYKKAPSKKKVKI